MAEYTFKPSERMTFATVQADCKRLNSGFSGLTATELCIDLSAVKRCNSAGMALLIEAKRLAKVRKIPCSFKGMSQDINTLAEFCGVQSLLSASI